MKNKGFTLIELIIVIAILGIISVIAIPRFVGYNAKASEETCNSNRRNIIRVYLTERTSGDNVNMQDIIDNKDGKYFNSIAECPDGGTYTFTGNDEDGYILSCSVHGDLHVNVTIGDDGRISYTFGNDKTFNTINDLFALALRSGDSHWIYTNDGLVSNNGGEELLYFDNEYDTYSIESTAFLNENREGYGIIFETYLNDDGNGTIEKSEDLGYIFQFDPGYTRGDDGRLLIRKRTDGWSGESNPIFQIDPSTIEDLNYSNTFWTDSHTIRVDVKEDTEDNTKKQVDAYVDGIRVTDDNGIKVDSVPEGEVNKAGFRSWGNVEATIKDLNIEPL